MRNPTKDWSKLWPVIQAAYLTGSFSLRLLAARFGVSFAAVSAHATEEKWAAQRNSSLKQVKQVKPSKQVTAKQVKQVTEPARMQAERVCERALTVAAREGTRIGHSAAGFVQRTLDEVTEWLDLIADLRRRLPPEASLQYMPQWRTAIEKGREAYRLDDVDPVQPLISLHGTSQMLEMVESVEGHWEQSGGGPAAAPSIVTRPGEAETPQPVVGPTPQP